MAARRRVALGFLGTNLDLSKRGGDRFSKWRPSVALAMQPGLPLDRFVVLASHEHDALAAEVAADIRKVSPKTRVETIDAGIADPWDFEEVFGALLDVSRRLAFDAEAVDLLVHLTTGSHVAQICLFLLVESRYLPGRLVQTRPARDAPTAGQARAAKLRAPAGDAVIVDLDLSRYDRLAQRFAREHLEGASLLRSGIATKNAAYNRLVDRLERVAIASRAPILLLGPTGAGKSQLARRIHELKRARNLVRGPLVDVNCATIRGDGASSALFGHKRGAFTGAEAARAGYLKSADGGVLFLDEIGELGLEEQAMLLRAIEDKTFFPVGSDREEKSDFVLVAGTNRDLRAAVREGRFREDLLARIDVWSFRLPGLAERREDLAPNLEHQLATVSTRLGTRLTMSREAREHFVDFGTSPRALWRASFRDLDAAVVRMGTLAPGGRIGVADVEAEIARLEDAWADAPAAGATAPDALASLLGEDAVKDLDRFDRVQLADVVAVCRASRSLSEAGRTLFSASLAARTTKNDADRLRKYLARFGLSFAAIRGE